MLPALVEAECAGASSALPLDFGSAGHRSPHTVSPMERVSLLARSTIQNDEYKGNPPIHMK